MQAFFLGVLKNLIVAAALAFISFLLFKPKSPEPPEPQANDFSPTAKEGSEIRELFGTGPVRFMVVAVVNRSVEPIRVG